MALILPHMIRHGEQRHITEDYVSVPPALTITDETGAVWTLGFRFGVAPRGEFAFNVLRNGVDTSEVASRIERRRGRVRIFTAQGWKQLVTTPEQDVHVCGIGARLRGALPAQAPVRVVVFRDGSDAPLVALAVDPASGGVWDGVRTPLVCQPGVWLRAVVTPADAGAFVEVMASLQGRELREIPVVSAVELVEKESRS